MERENLEDFLDADEPEGVLVGTRWTYLWSQEERVDCHRTDRESIPSRRVLRVWACCLPNLLVRYMWTSWWEWFIGRFRSGAFRLPSPCFNFSQKVWKLIDVSYFFSAPVFLNENLRWIFVELNASDDNCQTKKEVSWKKCSKSCEYWITAFLLENQIINKCVR